MPTAEPGETAMLETSILYRRGRPGDPDDSRSALALAMLRHRARVRSDSDRRARLQCLECSHRFRSASLMPCCPRCVGSDCEVI